MDNPNVRRADAVPDLLSGAVQASLVNCGQDTKLLLRDGSTILLKGISRLDGVLRRAGSETPPIGGEISGNGQNAHHRRNGGEGLGRIGE
jgi:hypothetical protein